MLGKQQRPSVGCCLTAKEGLNRWRGKRPALQAGDLGELEQKKNIQQILFLIFPATLTSLSFNSLINIKQQSKALNRCLMNGELNE